MVKNQFDNNRLSTLSDQGRIAFVATLLEKVGQFYSDHFRASFGLDRVIATAWTFVENQEVATAELQKLMRSIQKCFKRAEQEGYDQNAVGMGYTLLEEIKYRDASCAVASIDMAATAYGCAKLHSQLLSPGDPRISQQYFEDLIRPFFQSAEKAFDLVVTLENKRQLRRTELGFVALPFAFKSPTPKQMLNVANGTFIPTPPNAERDFWTAMTKDRT